MKHPALKWNPQTEEWFCTHCFRASDHITIRDAELELESVRLHCRNRRYPGRFADGQLRTLQRRVKVWRATEGPAKEVFFAQRHHPGRLSASDFTHMNEVGITIQGQSFPHLMYHLVLTYSNWESATVCYSENFESLLIALIIESKWPRKCPC